MKYLVIIIGLLVVIDISGQDLDMIRFRDRGIELRGNLHGGISKGNFLGDHISTNNPLSLWGDLGVAYFFNEYWGVSIGLGISQYRSNLFLDQYNSVINQIDGDDSYQLWVWTQLPDNTPDYILRDYEEDRGTRWSEDIKMLNVDIPLALEFRTPLSMRINRRPTYFSSSIGAKLGIPQKSTYKQNNGSITTRVYFPDDNILIYDEPNIGLYDNRDNWGMSGNINTRITASAFITAGLDMPLKDNLSLYAGAYFSYGMNDISSDRQEYLVPSINEYNSITTVANSSNPIQAGLTLGVRFGFGKAVSKKSKVGRVDKFFANANKIIASNTDTIYSDSSLEYMAEPIETKEYINVYDRYGAQIYSENLTPYQGLFNSKGFQIGYSDGNNVVNLFSDNWNIRPLINIDMQEALDVRPLSESSFIEANAKVALASDIYLDEILAIINSNSDKNILIEVYSESKKGQEIDRNLSKKRAEMIELYVSSKMTSNNRLIVISKGDNYPSGMNTDEKKSKNSMILNQLVEIYLYKD